MKKIYILLLFSFLFSYSSYAQIFGNTYQTGYGSYGANHIVWIKIITGPSDSGMFTHYGVYDHPTQGGNCEIKYAIYSHNAATDRPDLLLTSDYNPSPVNGAYNQHPLSTPISISPSTTYWIGLRFPCTYGSGREVGVNWPEPPLRYKASWSWIGNWPSPAGSVSTQGSLNHVALWLVGNNMLLPVEMKSFEVENIDNAGHLNWTVASELNNEGWNIQKSTNGFSYETIGFVEGKNTTEIESSYSYIDEQVDAGLAFYRLEQIDIDGTKSYTEVKTIRFSAKDLSVYPTQVSTVLKVSGIKKETNYQIFDAQGQFISKGKIQTGESIEVYSLSSGTHFIEIDGEFFTFFKM